MKIFITLALVFFISSCEKDRVVTNDPVISKKPEIKVNPPIKKDPPVKVDPPVKKDPPIKVEPPVKKDPPIKVEPPVKKDPPIKADPPVKKDPISTIEYKAINSININKSSRRIAWSKEWTFALAEVLSSDLSIIFDTEIIQTDLDLVGCKNYNELNLLDKKIFMIIFLSAISEAESDFREGVENLNPGDSTLNIGLLQIDVASAIRHSGHKYSVKNDEDLKKGTINLKVGAHILKNQITKSKYKGKLFPEKSYYWQVLSGSKVRIFKNINLNRESIGFCNK